MTNPNDCAYPADNQTQTEGGLTKREYFAAQAMQGLLAYGIKLDVSRPSEKKMLISRAIACADELIDELNDDNLQHRGKFV